MNVNKLEKIQKLGTKANKYVIFKTKYKKNTTQ